MAGSVAEPDSRLRVLDTGEQLPLVQQLQRQGLMRPCALTKMTAGVGRALPASMMRGLSQFESTCGCQAS